MYHRHSPHVGKSAWRHEPKNICVDATLSSDRFDMTSVDTVHDGKEKIAQFHLVQWPGRGFNRSFMSMGISTESRVAQQAHRWPLVDVQLWKSGYGSLVSLLLQSYQIGYIRNNDQIWQKNTQPYA